MSIPVLENAQCSIANTQTWPYPSAAPADNVWNCALALPDTTSTVDGKAPFNEDAGLVIKGYYIVSYLKDDSSSPLSIESISLATTTELFFSAGSGATSVTTYAAAVVAAIAAFLY